MQTLLVIITLAVIIYALPHVETAALHVDLCDLLDILDFIGYYFSQFHRLNQYI